MRVTATSSAPGSEPSRPFSAVIFDAEGVIIDTEPVWDEGQRVFLARRGINYDRARVKVHLTGRSLEDGTRALMDLYGLDGELRSLARERGEIVRDLMAEVDFVPGFRSFYERARADYRTCVATAMADDLFDIVDSRLGIRALFDGHVYMLSEVDFRSKPDPSLFLYAARQIDAPPESCIVVEDAPHGITAGIQAGMKVVGLSTTYPPGELREADLVVSSYADLDLGRLAGQARP